MLRPHFRYFFRLLLYYLTLFAFWRTVFIAVNIWSKTDSDAWAVLPAFLHGLRMDLSVIGYLAAPLILLWTARQFLHGNWTDVVQRILQRCYVVLITLSLLGNSIIYRFWGTLLNYRALTYLTDPKEVIINLSPLQSGLIVTVVAIMLWASLILLRRMVPHAFPKTEMKKPAVVGTSIFLLLVALLAVRGGLQKNPMNESLVYFSSDLSANNAAVNPIWHLAYDASNALSDSKNPFAFMDATSAEAALSGYRAHRLDPSPTILTVERPNIVLLLLESFTADIVGAMGGDTGVTPFMDSLIARGLFFDSIYSSGFRTDQGIASVLNGWPATPYHSIMRSVEKCRRLPSLSRELTRVGYYTSYYYGGESNFSNLNAYLLEQGFAKVTDQASFGEDATRGQWGVHDRDVLLRQSADLDKAPEPFFSMVMTLSNHEPFDVPGPKYFPGSGAPDKFRNAARYTDTSLRDYFKDAEKKPWYKNTLFILVADHAHELPRQRYVLYPVGRHIPLLFYGAVLTDSLCGTRIGILGGHHDIAGTLMNQLGFDAVAFNWSKNLLAAEAPSFAYLPYENYLTWVFPGGWFLRSFEADSIIAGSKGLQLKKDDANDRFSRAFMQEHYADYLRY